MKTRDYADASLDREAAEWLVRMEDPDADSEDRDLQAQFFGWLQQSPRHVQAYMEAAETFRQLDRLDSRREVNVRELVANRSADVIPLRDGEARPAAGATPGYPNAAAARKGPLRRLESEAAFDGCCGRRGHSSRSGRHHDLEPVRRTGLCSGTWRAAHVQAR